MIGSKQRFVDQQKPAVCEAGGLCDYCVLNEAPEARHGHVNVPTALTNQRINHD